jgi:hypothetical protein
MVKSHRKQWCALAADIVLILSNQPPRSSWDNRLMSLIATQRPMAVSGSQAMVVLERRVRKKNMIYS